MRGSAPGVVSGGEDDLRQGRPARPAGTVRVRARTRVWVRVEVGVGVGVRVRAMARARARARVTVRDRNRVRVRVGPLILKATLLAERNRANSNPTLNRNPGPAFFAQPWPKL